MATSPDAQDPRALAMAWFWSRPSSADVGDAVDLETLDQWRQGLLSPERSGQVKRQLADDPRVMRMLEELMAADDLVQHWAAEEEEAVAPRPSLWARSRELAAEALSRLLEPRWAGGLVAATASVLFVAMLLPRLITPDLERGLNGLYAELDAPPEDLTLPWGPKIAMRGGPGADADAKLPERRRLAKRAFQAGMVDGMERLSARYPKVDLNVDGRLRAERPDCAAGDRGCRELVDLAHATGGWALAAYVQCRASPAVDQPQALELLPALQKAWRKLPGGHLLGADVDAIVADQNPCEAVRLLLRAWGRS